MPAYSVITIDHLQHPRNVGRLPHATAEGVVDHPDTETTITIYIEVSDLTVRRASFRAFGCSACIAASSMVTELLTNLALSSVELVDGTLIDRALGGLPEEKRYCADLAAEAARRAAKASPRESPLPSQA